MKKLICLYSALILSTAGCGYDLDPEEKDLFPDDDGLSSDVRKAKRQENVDPTNLLGVWNADKSFQNKEKVNQHVRIKFDKKLFYSSVLCKKNGIKREVLSKASYERNEKGDVLITSPVDVKNHGDEKLFCESTLVNLNQFNVQLKNKKLEVEGKDLYSKFSDLEPRKPDPDKPGPKPPGKDLSDLFKIKKQRDLNDSLIGFWKDLEHKIEGEANDQKKNQDSELDDFQFVDSTGKNIEQHIRMDFTDADVTVVSRCQHKKNKKLVFYLSVLTPYSIVGEKIWIKKTDEDSNEMTDGKVTIKCTLTLNEGMIPFKIEEGKLLLGRKAQFEKLTN